MKLYHGTNAMQYSFHTNKALLKLALKEVRSV